MKSTEKTCYQPEYALNVMLPKRIQKKTCLHNNDSEVLLQDHLKLFLKLEFDKY